MSRKNDFVMQPLQKKLNRQNIISRLERVESRRLAPSARIGTLAELTQATGDLVLLGNLKIIDPNTGAVNVEAGPGGITFENNANFFIFKDNAGNPTLYIYSSTDNRLGLVSSVTGGSVEQQIQLTDLSTPSVRFLEDPGNTNGAQFTISAATNGVNWTVGGGDVVIWAGKDGTETVFNDGSYDIDLRVEGANDTNLLKIDAGEDAVGFGGAPTTSGALLYAHSYPMMVPIYKGTATTDTGTIINFYPPGNLPSGYDTFMVRVSLRSDRAATAEGALLQLNNQSSSDYSNYVMWHNFDNQFNDSAQSSSDTTSRPAILFANAANSPTNEFACYEIWFYDVSSTTKNKTWQVRGFQRASTANTQFFIYDSVGSWHPTTPAALTNISIETQNGSNWIAGSEWWVYAA